MQVPTQITFRGMEHSDFVEAAVRKQAARLERFYGRLTACHVTVEAPHHHQRTGNVYRVRIELMVPGSQVVVAREPGNNHAHEDVYVAIRDAFDAATRQLEDVLRRSRAQRRPHERPLRGRVTQLSPEEHHGFLETQDGLVVYFHENSVLEGQFPNLHLGDELRVVVAETESLKGPQATTVQRIS